MAYNHSYTKEELDRLQAILDKEKEIEKEVPSANEILDNFHINVNTQDEANLANIKAMIKFAQLHVEKALIRASRKADLKDKPVFSRMDGWTENLVVDEESILNAYPLSLIK